MMVCRLKLKNEEEVARPWRVGDNPPYEVWEVAEAERVQVLADGDEYDYVFDRFGNMPVPKDRSIFCGVLTPRSKSVNFFGDMAKFILANL